MRSVAADGGKGLLEVAGAETSAAGLDAAAGSPPPRDPGMTQVTPANDRSAVQRDRDDGEVNKQTRASQKVKRGAKRVVKKERGVE